MARENQNETPLFTAVKKYVDDKVIPFHVPGHKQGNGIDELREYLGEKVLQMDVNGMPDLDFANNPTGVIKESEKLLAEAFGSEHAFFLINGASSGVQAMIMSACNPGDKIIIPRNAHKSTIGGIILSGAIPIYIQPEVNEKLGIAMGITEESLKETIKENPYAKALFLINPTYYGVAYDLKAIVRIAKKHGLIVLVDEAHGSHMSFHGDFPLTAMEIGADMATASLHKTTGAMTQSAALLMNHNHVSPERVKQIINLTFSTSASYLLMCSIDIARKQLVTKGSEMFDEVLENVRWARNEINKIEGLYAFGRELIGKDGCFDFDETKLGVNVSSLGYTGYEIETLLRKKYNIQLELADLYNILAIASVGDKKEYFEILINALREIALNAEKKEKKINRFIPKPPNMIVAPRDAFYSPKKTVKLEEAEGEIAGEMVMAYPPGIPVICPGERITGEIIEYINILKNENCELQGAGDPYVEYLRVLGIG